MTARDTYESSVKTAGKSKADTLPTNEMAKQTTIDAKLSVVGYTLQTGNYANFAAAVLAAADVVKVILVIVRPR